MEMACKFCEWWKEHTDKYDKNGCGNCFNSHFVYIGFDSETPVDGLGYWDYESYQAGFETGSDFGCIHFVLNKKLTDQPEKASDTDKIDPDELEISLTGG